MVSKLSKNQEFINKLYSILEINLENEQFGVKELAIESGFSRSQLHRKLYVLTKKSTSRFIREYRLEKAMIMLQNNVATSSEIAYRVGFGSPTYFNTCFHNYYGYPPGEVKYRSDNEAISQISIPIGQSSINPINIISKKNKAIFTVAISLVFICISLYIIYNYSENNAINKAHNTINSEKSIAVLPFKNLSDDKKNQYFADGVMEAVINHLSVINNFKVISTTTMEQYRKTNLTAPEIAKELNVSYIIESSIQKYGDTVKVTTQLIDAKNDNHIWSKKFERAFKNIFTLESDIAKQIAVALEIKLSPLEIKQVEKIPTKNFEAYNLYIQGKYFFNFVTSEDNAKSRSYFNKAIEKDHEFALAYAALADTYTFSADNLLFNDSLKKAKELALKALAIDNSIAEAHAVLGAIECMYNWNWKKAEEEYKLALQLNPNSAKAYIYYSQFLFSVKGQFDDARIQINKARYLDPLSFMATMKSANYYVFEGCFDDAFAETKKAMELTKDDGWPNWVNFENYIKQGKDEIAFEELLKYHKANSSDFFVSMLKDSYEEGGIMGIYKFFLDLTLDRSKIASDLCDLELYNAIQQLSILGEIDKALDRLEIEYSRKSNRLFRIKYDPYLENLHSEPRFLTILNKMKLGGYD